MDMDMDMGDRVSAIRASPVFRDVYYRCLAWKVVRKHVPHRRHRYADRRVLEQIIIPFILSRFEPQTVLEVGREPYEAFYNEFFVGRELWTIDWDAARAQFGAPKHIVDDAANLRNHFPDAIFRRCADERRLRLGSEPARSH